MTRFQKLGVAGLGALPLLAPLAAHAQTLPNCPAGQAPVILASGYICQPINAGANYGSYAAEPRYGSPNSMQFQAVSTALDLNTLDPEDGYDVGGDADTIGGAFTYFGAGGQEGQRYEGRYQRQSRLGEGTRARLLIDLPIAALHADGIGTAVYGTLNGGIELPVKPNWLVTPRLAYGNLQAGRNFFYDGELGTVSVTSRYKLPQVGRGDLTIGNMVAYAHTLNTFLSHQPGYTDSDVFTFRNGLAYQLPLKRRMFGRQTSLRGSYVFTYTTGETGIAFKQIHEVGLNIGVRTREAEQKNRFEQMRIGLLYTHGTNEFSGKAGYDAATLTVGYRF